MEAVERRTLVRAHGDEALQHGDGSGIVFLAEIDANEEGAHGCWGPVLKMWASDALLAVSKALNGHK